MPNHLLEPLNKCFFFPTTSLRVNLNELMAHFGFSSTEQSILGGTPFKRELIVLEFAVSQLNVHWRSTCGLSLAPERSRQSALHRPNKLPAYRERPLPHPCGNGL